LPRRTVDKYHPRARPDRGERIILRGIVLGTWMAGVVGIGGCSGKLDPAEDCIEEFVQEYQFEGGNRKATAYCDDQDLSGPPEYPVDSTVVRIEYTNGSFFTVQKRLVWVGKQNPDNLNCQLVWQQERVVYIRNDHGKEKVVAMVDGEVVDDYRKQLNHRGSVLFGADPSLVTVRGEKAARNAEKTPFGMDCVMRERRIDQWSAVYGRACMPVAPKKQCRAHEMMLPMQLTGEIDGTPATGRTTSFVYGKKGSLVDPSKWTMPEGGAPPPASW
jgi:hypothetical protein